MMKTAVVTGASGAIGGAVSKALALNGYYVVMAYNKSKNDALSILEEIKNDGLSASIFKCDVKNEEATDKLMSFAAEAFGRIDVLVNNAGVSLQKLFQDVTRPEYDEVFDINVRGVFNCCKSASKYMLDKKNGSIVNISSMWGICGASCEAHYSASKAAVIGLTKSLAKELGPSGIRVNCVAPGMIDTKMNSHLSAEVFEQIKSETPLGRIGNCMDIANAVMFFAKDESSFVTGQTLCVDGGFIL